MFLSTGGRCPGDCINLKSVCPSIMTHNLITWQPVCDCKDGYARLPNGLCVLKTNAYCVALYEPSPGGMFLFFFIRDSKCGLSKTWSHFQKIVEGSENCTVRVDRHANAAAKTTAIQIFATKVKRTKLIQSNFLF